MQRGGASFGQVFICASGKRGEGQFQTPGSIVPCRMGGFKPQI
jgi:hypothetical protein